MGFLVLCFDDGHSDTYTTAYPMIKKYDAVAVVGVITSYVGALWRDWDEDDEYRDFQLATLSQLLELRASGWEMASHSLTHSPQEFSLTGNNLEYFDMSLKESRDWIVRNRLGDGRTFIYPFGRTPGNLTEIAKKYYWLARTVASGPPGAYYDLPLDSNQRYRLASYEVQHPVSPENLIEIRKRVRYAKEERALMTFHFHRVTANQPRIYDVTPQELETVLGIIAEENVQTSTFERAIEQVWGIQANAQSGTEPRTEQ